MPGVAFAEIAANVSGTSFTDSTAQAGTSYTYRVRAENAGTFSGYTSNVSITTGSPSAPAAPASVTATVNSSSQISLGWSSVSGAASYIIQRQTAGSSSWTTLSSAWTAGTNYTDTNVLPNTQYTYQVAAQNGAGASAFVQAQAITQGGAYQSADINAATTGGTLDNVDGSSYDISAYGVDIGSTSTDSFRFVYKPLTGNFDAVVQVQSLVNTFSTAKAGLMVRSTLDAGSAMIFDGATAASSFRWLYRNAPNAVPSFNSVGTNITYPNAWVRLVRKANVFTGYYSTDGLTWTQSGTVTLNLGSTIYFGMAVTSHNTSAMTTAQFRSLSILTAPAAPSATAAANSSSAITVSWASVPSASTYTVMRFNPQTSAYATIATGVTGTAYADTGLASSTMYQYQVIAVNTVGSSPASNVAPATTLSASTPPPASPNDVTGNSPSSSEIDINWTPPSGATSYSILRSANGGSTWTVLASNWCKRRSRTRRSRPILRISTKSSPPIRAALPRRALHLRSPRSKSPRRRPRRFSRPVLRQLQRLT